MNELLAEFHFLRPYWLIALLPALLSANSYRSPENLANTVCDRSPISLSLSPDKTLVAVANHTANTVSLVELASGRVLFETACGQAPVDIAWWDSQTLLVSLLGQLGDLTLSSIKSDVGIEDVGATLPGHGGLLDRFDSLVLVPPAVYHYLSLAMGHTGPLGSEGPHRILTGGWGG